MNELITEIYKLQKEKDAIEKTVEEAKAKISVLDQDIEAKKAMLLAAMDSADAKVVNDADDDLVAEVFSKETICYTDEKAVLQYLIDNNYDAYITVKKSINKVPLNKGMKTDAELAAKLEGMTSKNVFKYVVVSTTENNKLMHEHISKRKSKK